MSQSPRANVSVPRISAKEFRDKVHLYIKRLKMAVDIQKKTYKLKPGQTYQIGPYFYDRRKANADVASVLRTLEELPRYYRAAIKRKSTGVLSLNSGLRKPILVNDFMHAFINEVDATGLSIFGRSRVVEGNNPRTDFREGASLKDDLQLAMTQRIGSRVLFNSLFHIYISRHGLVARAAMNQGLPPEQHNGLFFAPDALLMRYFGQTFAQMELMSQNEIANSLDANGRPAVEGAPRPPKAGKERRYTTKNGQPIYTSHFHAFRTDNISRASIPTLIKLNLDPINAELNTSFKLDPAAGAVKNEQAAYNAAIKRARENNLPSDFVAIAKEAIDTLQRSGVATQEAVDRLTLRGRADAEEALVRETLRTYKSEPKKKASRRAQ